MDSSSSSQKKIRKVLRNRRLSISPLQAKVVKEKNRSEKPSIPKEILDESLVNFKPNKTSSLTEKVQKTQKNHEKKSKIEKLNAKINVQTTPASEVIVQHTESEELSEIEASIVDENDEDRGVDLTIEEDEEEHQGYESEVDEGENDANVENNVETDFLGGDCVADILKGFNKDIGSLYSKSDRLEADVKEIKRLLKSQPPHHCTFRSLSSQFTQKSAVVLIPKLPLTKRSQVRKMQGSVDDSEEYEMQIVNKLASFGGKSVQQVVVNIFNKLFTPKLKTKYCWRGSSKGKGKTAFKKLTNLVDVIWSAVKVHFADCTEAMVKSEIKLRLNQAQKDYDRAMNKQNV